MVLEFGLLKSGLFPASEVSGEGVASDNDAALLNDDGQICVMKTGGYTGDGSTSHAIVGLGFAPKMVCVWIGGLLHGGGNIYYWGTDADDRPDKSFIYARDTDEFKTRIDDFNSLDDDGFNVSDRGSNANPNTNGVTYLFMAWGYRSVI